MNDNHHLYRKAYFSAQSTRSEGRVLISPAPGMTIFACLSSALVCALIAFLILGTYTRKARLEGVVMPSTGVVKVVARTEGFVKNLLVKEGDIVSAGRLRVFGIDHHQEVFGQVRQIIGAVMQEDRLFQGAILDNITFFAQEMDLARAQHCAVLAQLHEDIIALPMGYQTLIGELGNSLSGGQKQRLLLARALYKRPRLLILDEATSHLDVTNEILIGNTLRGLGLTILLIAHRPETIASADRVMVLENGKLIPSSSGRGKEDCCEA